MTCKDGYAQAAYARQWEEQVRKRQAELASRAGADAAAGQAGDPGKMKGEGGWTAEPQLTGGVKPEPKQEVQLVSPRLSWPFGGRPCRHATAQTRL